MKLLTTIRETSAYEKESIRDGNPLSLRENKVVKGFWKGNL